MTDEEKEALILRVAEEQHHDSDFQLLLYLDLTIALSLIGSLQLALRHPLNTGPSAQITREFIDGIIGRMQGSGYPAHAELARLGYDPTHDEPPEQRPGVAEQPAASRRPKPFHGGYRL